MTLPPQPPINPAFKSARSGSEYISGEYGQKVEELQRQLAAHKEELSRQSIGLHPQLYPVSSAGDQSKAKAIPRNPQSSGDTAVSSSSGGASGSSSEELQQQVLALQAELGRLQALIGS
jgi:uncharacterized small protein (DUF1192 family)